MAVASESKGQGQRKLSLLFVLLASWIFGSAQAIPPNTPITNTASVDYSVGGVSYSTSDSETVITDPGAGNSPPHGLLLDPANVDENAVAGVVGDLTIIDLDPSDTHTVVVDDPRFEVVGVSLQLRAGESLDFETEAAVALVITVTDSAGAPYAANLSVAVNDVNEAPTDVALSATTVAANVAGAVVGDLTVTDPDAGDSHSYTVDDPRFEVVGGELKLLDTEALPLGASVSVLVTVTDAGGLSYAETFEITADGNGSGGNSSIGFFQHAPGVIGSQNYDVGVAQCAGSDLADPVTVFGQTLAIPQAHELIAAVSFKSSDAVFVRVVDLDANTDPAAIDRVDVVLTTSSGDDETLSFAESAVDSGVFVGYVQTSSGSAVPGNCAIEADLRETLVGTYTDAGDATDIAAVSALVDPYGLVFDSATGAPINGATVTIVDESTGLPAQVFGDDGVSAFPATIVSVGGEYRFPFVNAGDYSLQVIPPNRFGFPSAALDSDLQTLPGAPYALSGASRGLPFAVPVGPAIRVDIPLDLLPVVPTDSQTSLFAVAAPGGGTGATYVGTGQCFDGADFVPQSDPVSLTRGAIGLPANVDVTDADRFARGDVVLIQVVDPDQDTDPFARDSVVVDVRVPGQADQERVELTETNDSTGVFSGYIQTALQPAVANNCTLEAEQGSEILVAYVDSGDAADTSGATALLDPGFTVFSSSTGARLDGATITLLDAGSGQPATVFSTDGVTSFPAVVVSGQTVVDGAGQSFNFAAGTFYFPTIPPGTYRLEVAPPISYLFPSRVDDATLEQLPAGPFAISEGSRGADFVVTAGAPAAFDVPLDPVQADVFVSKEASKDAAAVGEFVQYQIVVTNNDELGAVSDLNLTDTLPVGFRYAAGSMQLDDAPVVPAVGASGRSIALALPNLGPGESVEIAYVAEITVGAGLGPARNSVSVSGVGIGTTNTAFADVLVTEDLFRSSAMLVGQVYEGACSDTGAKGMEGIRVWLEDGTFVVTDAEGKFHFEGVEPGTHVVQLDTATLPSTHELVACEESTRFAGANHSQFVDLQGGSIWRTDFYVAKKPNAESVIIARLDAEAEDGYMRYQYHVRGGSVPLQKIRATIVLDDQLAYVEGTARINGASVPDPSGLDQGALVFRLPDTAADFEYTIEFDAFVKYARGLIETKSMMMFASRAGNHRSSVNTNALSLNWPSSLIVVAESVGSQVRTSLRKARPARSLDVVAIRSEVHEPSRGSNRSRSDVSSTTVSVEPLADSNRPYELPSIDRGEVPSFDVAWLEADGREPGIAWPPVDYNPVIPAIAVAVVHESGMRPQVLVDGTLVNPLTFEGTTTHHGLGMSVTRWDNVTVSENDSVIEARVLDRDGETVNAYRRPVHFSGAPASARLVKEESYLVADGLYPPVIAVQLKDRQGYPLRPGTTGEFAVLPPYQAFDQTKHLETVDNEFNNQRFQVMRDGIAYLQLEPTTATGEVQVEFQFDQVRRETVRARLVPGARDWIMVGLVEGSYAANSLDGNEAGLDEHDLDDSFDGRVAFYAKGMVRGDWLLTAAYDTDKKFERRLREQINPNQFYTLYGDGTQQLYDAESQQKLYLKVEKERFAGLFGDFDAEFNRSELARYDRRMNGVNLGFFGDQVEVKAFASNTDQAFMRDEFRGDGTSGVYRLSNRRLVVNSEVVKLVTRDRFRTEEVLSETTLTRYLDYTIDYAAGTIIFKQPIFSQDESFNPNFIEVEYEVANLSSDESVVAGTRMAYRLDDQDSEVALTYVNDGAHNLGGDLLGLDVTWQFTDEEKVTAEFARTDTDIGGRGDAYLLELEHMSENLAGKIYLREQDEHFGLGHQSALEAGTRKMGFDGEYRVSEGLILRTQTFRQTLLATGAERTVASAEGEYQLGETRMTSGLQSVREENAEGGSMDANQVTLGMTHSLFNNDLLLRGDAEIDVGSGDGNTDFPSRAVFGVEYEVLNGVNFVTEQEVSWGDSRDTQDTRFGVKSRPWAGADISSIVTRRTGENGQRVFATTGLLQQWRLNEKWLLDVGFDRVNTVTEEGELDDPNALLFNPGLPAASGSFNEDFTAFFTGAGYRHANWDVSTRLEFHDGDQADKWNFLAGANHQLADGKVMSGSIALLNEESSIGTIQDSADVRFGLAWRPNNSRWTLLNRTDLVFEERLDSVFDARSRKWVNNFNANFKPREKHQVSLQLGFKYVVEHYDGEDYSGVTSLLGAEYRYDLTPRWDLGVRGSMLKSHKSDVRHLSWGLSVGYNVVQNAWISLGYNFTGFDDDDFIAADYTARGPFVKVRMKLDQELARRFLEFAGLDIRD